MRTLKQIGAALAALTMTAGIALAQTFPPGPWLPITNIIANTGQPVTLGWDDFSDLVGLEVWTTETLDNPDWQLLSITRGGDTVTRFALNELGLVSPSMTPTRFYRLRGVRGPAVPSVPVITLPGTGGGSDTHYVKIDVDSSLNDLGDIYVKSEGNGNPIVPPTFWSAVGGGTPVRVYADGKGGWDTVPHTCPPGSTVVTLPGGGGGSYVKIDIDVTLGTVYVKTDGNGNPIVPPTFWISVDGTTVRVYPDGKGGWSTSPHICPPGSTIVTIPGTGGGADSHYVKIDVDVTLGDIHVKTDGNGNPIVPPTFWIAVGGGTPVQAYPDGKGGWSLSPHTCKPIIIGNGPYFVNVGTNSLGDTIYVKVNGDGTVILPPTIWTNVLINAVQIFPAAGCTCAAGCPCCGGGSGTPSFVAVTGITGVPTDAFVGTPLTLTGTVLPGNASNQTIVWSLVNAGTTGASLAGNILSATAAGTVTVRATIVNGAGPGLNVTKDFQITVTNPFVPVTNITGVPTPAVIETPLTLTGTVAPGNATNKGITWTLVSAGTTGATLAGGVLTATDLGSVTVRATVANGSAVGTAYTKDFVIPVVPATGWNGVSHTIGINLDTYAVTTYAANHAAPANANTIYLRHVRAGGFTMGSPATEFGRGLGASAAASEDQTPVTLSSYYIGVYQVTEAQYAKVMGEAASTSLKPKATISYATIRGDANPANATGSNALGSFMARLNAKIRAANPGLVNISFDLPTEAQWEFACRAGTTGTVSDGNTAISTTETDLRNRLNSGNLAWFDGTSTGTTYDIGGKAANPALLYDMHGNAWDWCRDAHDRTAGLIGNHNPRSDSGTYRALRGGCWYSGPRFVRSAYRYSDTSGAAATAMGFRVGAYGASAQ